MSALTELVKDYIVEYNSEDEYVKENNINLMDWENWKKQGYSDDGFLQIMDCYCLAGNATTGNMVAIDNLDEVTDLLIEEMEESSFNDIIECLNDDNPENKIDMNNTYECLEVFLGYCSEVAIFKQTTGKYKNHYCLVIDED